MTPPNPKTLQMHTTGRWGYYKAMNEEIIVAIKKSIKRFDTLDLKDPMMVVGVNSVAMTALASVTVQKYPGFDGDVQFDYDPDPYLKVSWWHSMTGAGDELVFRFKPLRVEGDMSDLIAAYDRAMVII